MNTAVDIGFELKMSSKKEYIENFDQKFDAIFDQQFPLYPDPQ